MKRLFLISVILFTGSALYCVRGGIFETADSLYRIGELESASEYASAAVAKAEGATDTTLLIKALCLLTEIAVDQGNDTDAVLYYNRCFDISGYGEPMFMLSSSLYNIANIYYQNEDYDRAEEYIEKSIAIDSHREKDAVLALRYLMAAQIQLGKGNYERALALAAKGRKYSVVKNNANVTGRLLFIEALCRDCIDAGKDWKSVEDDYKVAIKTVLEGCPPIYYTRNCNPYVSEMYFHLGEAADARGKDCTEWMEMACKTSLRVQKMRGLIPLVAFNSSTILAEKYTELGQVEKAAHYRNIADSLSFAPYIKEMSTKLSLSQMEFIRREKERQLENQRGKTFAVSVGATLLFVLLLVILVAYIKLARRNKAIAQKNAQLVKLDIQKDKLLSLFNETSQNSELVSEVEKIARDEVPLPSIQLSRRENEILLMCYKGLTNKEVAAKLNISVRTVETHKFNIFKKVGVNTTAELITFAYKAGLIRTNE